MQQLQDHEQLLIRQDKEKNSKIFAKKASPFHENSSKDIDAGASKSELPLATSTNILSHNKININLGEAGSLEIEFLILPLFVCLILLTIRLFKSN